MRKVSFDENRIGGFKFSFLSSSTPSPHKKINYAFLLLKDTFPPFPTLKIYVEEYIKDTLGRG